VSEKIHPPWDEATVTWLNLYQRAGGMHPFTCPRHEDGSVKRMLVARPDAWHCPDMACAYIQRWAHAFMADPRTWPSVVNGTVTFDGNTVTVRRGRLYEDPSSPESASYLSRRDRLERFVRRALVTDVAAEKLLLYDAMFHRHVRWTTALVQALDDALDREGVSVTARDAAFTETLLDDEQRREIEVSARLKLSQAATELLDDLGAPGLGFEEAP
jgi:hypothetical protein